MANYRESRKSVESYVAWRMKRERPVVTKINNVRKLRGSTVLEIGCGYGALLSLLAKSGAKAIGVEVDESSLKIARKLTKGIKNAKVVKGQGENLDFDDASFDIVILFDVIEHVKNPLKMMKEAIRVLKPGGILYCEFTPYYSLAGHHLYDISKLPIHVLPEKYIKKLVYRKKVKGMFNADAYWNDYLSLNKLRIAHFQRSVSGLEVIEENYIFKYPDVFEVAIPFLAYLGPLKDIFALSFEGFYRKKDR